MGGGVASLVARKLSLFVDVEKKGLEHQQDPLPLLELLPLELLVLNFGKLCCLRFLCFVQVLQIARVVVVVVMVCRLSV